VTRRRPTGEGDAERIRVFDDLYAATYDRVLAYCRRRTWCLADAEDAVAETFVVAWRKLDDATTAESPLLWLYRVAFRVTANQRRGRIRIERLIDRLTRFVTSATVPPPDTEILTDADPEQVRAALAILSSLDREIVRLVAYEQLPRTEVATVLGLSPGAVRTRLYRARRRLREHLNDEARRDVHAEPDTYTDEGPTGDDPAGPEPRSRQP